MKHIICHVKRLVHVNVDQMQVFVMINIIAIMINADANVKNQVIKVDVMIGLR